MDADYKNFTKNLLGNTCTPLQCLHTCFFVNWIASFSITGLLMRFLNAFHSVCLHDE